MRSLFKDLTRISGLVLMTLLFTFCSKESVLENNEQAGVKGGLPLPTIGADITPMTKTEIGNDGKVSWDAKDELMVFAVTENYNSYSWFSYRYKYITSEADCKNNIFKPHTDKVPTLDPAKKYNWYAMSPYNSSVRNPLGTEGDHGFFDFSAGQGQEIDPTNTLANIAKYDIMTGVNLGLAADQSPKFAMEHKCALMKFTLFNKENKAVEVNGLEFTAPENVFIGGRFMINFAAGKEMVKLSSSQTKNYTKVCFVKDGKATPAIIKANESLDIYVVMPPFQLAAGDAFKIKAITNIGNLERTSIMKTAKNFKAATIHSAKYTIESIKVESVSLEAKELLLKKGDSQVLKANILPANADNQNVTWESDQPTIVKVDKDGKITALSHGTANIKVTTDDGAKTAVCKVSVMALGQSHFVLGKGENATVKIINLPADAGQISWTSSKPEVATVNAGQVSAIAEGYTIITATIEKSKTTFTAGVTVSPAGITVETIMAGNLPIRMIKVTKGKFTMGAADTDANAEADEKPAHEVTLTQDFYIGQFEVTQELWDAVMEKNPSSNAKQPLCPVENMTCPDIDQFIAALNKLTGKTFSLPTEAQWEFAARGGNSSKNYLYSGSNNIAEVAWNQENTPKIGEGWSAKQAPQNVGMLRPNELGIYDMSGNVREWCADFYDAKYYATSPAVDPTGAASGSQRVVRGGFCDEKVESQRITKRFRDSAGDYGYSKRNGFRLVLMSL